MNIRVTYKYGNLTSNWGTVRVSRRTQLHGFSYTISYFC